MALFLQLDQLFLLHSACYTSPTPHNQPEGEWSYNIVTKKFMEQLMKMQISPLLLNNLRTQLPTVNFHLKLKDKFQILYRVQINPKTKNICTHIFFKVSSSLKFISSFQLMLNTVKKIMIYNRIASSSLAFFVMHPVTHTVEVKIHTNTILLTKNQHYLKYLTYLVLQSQMFLNNFGPLLLFSCNHISNHQLFEYLPAQLRPLYFDISEKTNGYLPKLVEIKELLNFINFDIEPNPQRRNKKVSSIKSPQEANKILQSLPFARQQLQLQEVLWIQPSFIDLSKPISKEISYKSIQGMLIYPFEYATSVQDDISHIFNTISVVKVEDKEQKILNQKGKYRLSIVPIEYSFPMSEDIDSIDKKSIKEHSELIDSKLNNFRRQIVIKNPLHKNEFSKFLKLRWEKEILCNLRGAKNIYLPKYYNSIQEHFIYKDSLLIKFIPSSTLHDFLLMRTHSMSLGSKINVAVHITNAIRFLQEYKIAHLDLSPMNILVVKDHLIKIIDFGQSYSQETYKKNNGTMKNVCGQKKMPFKYKPGRTFPFCPPETTLRQKNFTNQQDIYSLGVNFFHMVFGQYPLPFAEKFLEMLFKSKSYQKRIFFAAQKLDTLGETELMTILFVLIMKMLDGDENKRPFPIWTHLLFRKLQLSMFY